MNKLLIVGVIAMVVLALIGATGQAIYAPFGQNTIPSTKTQLATELRAAPIAMVGDNIYIVWPTNRTGNDEVNFRASTDSGATFADKINLSNSTDAESQDVEIAADGDNVVITWWERNATSNEPVIRMSTDNGGTFGPLLNLAANGTIGS